MSKDKMELDYKPPSILITYIRLYTPTPYRGLITGGGVTRRPAFGFPIQGHHWHAALA